MSAKPKDTAPPVEMVEFEVDGHPVSASMGATIIQATDVAKIPVLRLHNPVG